LQLLVHGRRIPNAEMMARIDAVDANTIKRVADRFIYDKVRHQALRSLIVLSPSCQQIVDVRQGARKAIEKICKSFRFFFVRMELKGIATS
jgi:hypothetical protein